MGGFRSFCSNSATASTSSVVDAEEVKKPSEQIVGDLKKHEFQAHTKKLLDILGRSLYTDQSVFVRELISNASDALEKLRHAQVAGGGAAGDDGELPLAVHITCDEKAKTLTIQDYGIGMSEEDMVSNLGTIARSGTEEFLKTLDGSEEGAGLIGQFGVGFYSTFVVGERVTVYSRKAEGDAEGLCWVSDGSGSFELARADGVERGTKIVIQLKPSAYQFAKERHVEAVIKKYSNFVGFPIHLNGKKVNTIGALWMLPAQEISKEQHKEFYQSLAHAYDEPMTHLHFVSDAPMSIRALLYVPEFHQEKHGMGRMDPGVNLFSRKVLIQAKAKGLLPDWLRFVKGVVDCEDIQVNLSRDHLQDSEMVRRLGNVVTGKVIKHLTRMAEQDPETYAQFWNEYAPFIKEGVCVDLKWKNELGALLRYESSTADAGASTSLDAYVERMPDEQAEIYFQVAPNRAAAEASPYFESFRRHNVEVLFMYSNMDDFVMTNLAEYKGKKLVSIEASSPPKRADADADADADAGKSDADKKSAEKLSPQDLEELTKWMKQALSAKVTSVKETDRLYDSPAVIVDHESATYRNMARMIDPSRMPVLSKQRLEINAKHPIIRGLSKLRQKDESTATIVAEQIFDDALISAGLMDDARVIVPRINKLLEELLK